MQIWFLQRNSFFVFVSVHKNATKKKELGPNPAILTSRLVNNAYEYIFYADPYKSGNGRQYKKFPTEPQNLSNV